MWFSPFSAENTAVTPQTWACKRKNDYCVKAMKLSYPALQETKILCRLDKKTYLCFQISYNFEGKL